MVAGACRDHAAREALARQPRHLVVGAAQLEREYRLQVFAFQQQAIAQALGKRRRRLERRLGRDVVDPRLQNSLEIALGQSRANLAWRNSPPCLRSASLPRRSCPCPRKRRSSPMCTSIPTVQRSRLSSPPSATPPAA